jgi:hypothetical protein
MYGQKTESKGRKSHTVYSWNASEDIAALAREEAVLAGENARLRLELEEGENEGDFEVVRESMRLRLARSLVQLGIRIDPLAGEEPSDGE